MMVLSSLFPVFVLILLGNLVKRYKLSNEAFLRTSDRLVYFIFFPTMLFWKIGGAPPASTLEARLCLAAISALGLIYILSCLAIRIFKVTNFQAGSFSQSCYRFNTYIGVAVVMNALGEHGVRLFGILIGFLIPLINILAISTLIWFSGKRFTLKERIGISMKAIVSNPLILACISGIIYARFVNQFPLFLENTFQLMSFATLPLALFSIGGVLTLENLKGHFKVSFVASIIRLLIYPIIGFLFLRWFAVNGIAFRVGMIFFALPTSTAIYVLSSQLNSDTQLASASIVLSTLLSFCSLSAILLLF
ncbi:MAG: AEC family transporter [Desulfobacterales bacterium]